MTQLTLFFLGPITAKLGDQLITQFASDKVRALLVYLAVEAGQPHRRSALAGLLWPGYPERTARASLRNALSNLRKAIGDQQSRPTILIADRETIQFQFSSDCWLDVHSFEGYLDLYDTPSNDLLLQSETENLIAGVELYRGDFLHGFSLTDSPAFDEWTLLKRQDLKRKVVKACSKLAQGFEMSEDFEQAGIYANKLVDIEPWHEETHRQLMRMLAISGQRAAALAQYEACCQCLQGALEVGPSQETIRLYEMIRDGELKRSIRRKQRLHNLPAIPSRFVGREQELVELKTRLEDPGCRLLTLVGPGGYGKTRLAIEAARELIDHFQHGAALVPLAGIQAASEIPFAIGQALSISFNSEREPWQQILDYVRNKNILFVVDNFEHLVSGAHLLVDLLHSAPGVKILATSRGRLNVMDENLFLLRGMAYPGKTALENQTEELTSYPAVQLFLEGARRVKPGFKPGDEDLKQIGSLCRLVGGIPLVLLISSSWCGILTPRKIAANITKADLDFFETEWGDVPERHRSLRHVFDHSWELLNIEQQEALAALSVFPGSFRYQSAQAVIGMSLKTLRSLVDRSLVETTVGEQFLLHPLMRQYAQEKLAACTEKYLSVQDKHCAFFSNKLADWAAAVQCPRQLEAQQEITPEIENIRQAWSWGLEHNRFECLSEAVDGLGWLYERLCLYQEGEHVFKITAARIQECCLPDIDPSHIPLLVKTFAWQSVFNRMLGNHKIAAEGIRKGLDLLDCGSSQPQVLDADRAFLYHQRGALYFDSDREASQRDFEVSLSIYRRLGDRWHQAAVLNFLARIVFCRGNYRESIRLLEESLAIYRDCGDSVGIATTLILLSSKLTAFGDIEKMDAFVHKQAMKLRDLGSTSLLAEYLMKDGINQGFLGRFPEAWERNKAALDIYENLGDLRGCAGVGEILAWIEINQGIYDQSLERIHAALKLARKQGNMHLIAMGTMGLGEIDLACGELQQAQAHFKKSISYYRQATQQDELGVVLAELAHAEYQLGLIQPANKHLREAIRIAHQTGSWHTCVRVIGKAALSAVLQENFERGVELYTLATRYPYIGNSLFWEDTTGRHIDDRAAELTDEVRAAAEDRGRIRDLHATIKELLEEYSLIN